MNDLPDWIDEVSDEKSYFAVRQQHVDENRALGNELRSLIPDRFRSSQRSLPQQLDEFCRAIRDRGFHYDKLDQGHLTRSMFYKPKESIQKYSFGVLSEAFTSDVASLTQVNETLKSRLIDEDFDVMWNFIGAICLELVNLAVDIQAKQRKQAIAAQFPKLDREIEARNAAILSNDSELEAIPLGMESPTRKDGPCSDDSFAWQGVVYSGLQNLAWRLLNHVWNSRDRCASFDGLAIAVWQDAEYEFAGEPLTQAAKKVRKFLRDNEIPLGIRQSEKSRTVKIVECPAKDSD